MAGHQLCDGLLHVARALSGHEHLRLFVQLKGRGRSREGKPWKWLGLSQLLAWVCMNVVGGTLAEKTCAHLNLFS